MYTNDPKRKCFGEVVQRGTRCTDIFMVVLLHSETDFFSEVISMKFRYADVVELIAIIDERDGSTQCRRCQSFNGGDVVKIQIPYATKLLLQELISMCIFPKLEIGKEEL